MASELIINASLPETRITLVEDGEIQELLIERASGKGIVGNIYKGRVTRVLPGMQAAFVDIGLEKAAFLYVDDVYVHSEVWEQEEDASDEQIQKTDVRDNGETQSAAADPALAENSGVATPSDDARQSTREVHDASPEAGEDFAEQTDDQSDEDSSEAFDEEADLSEAAIDENEDQGDDEEEDEDDRGRPVDMGPPPGGGDDEDNGGDQDNVGHRIQPAGTVKPEAGTPAATQGMSEQESSEDFGGDSDEGSEGEDPVGASAEGGDARQPRNDGRRRHRRGRRGGRNRRRPLPGGGAQGQERREHPGSPQTGEGEDYVPPMQVQGDELGHVPNRPEPDQDGNVYTERVAESRGISTQDEEGQGSAPMRVEYRAATANRRPEFREQRSRDRRIRPKASSRMARPQVNIQDLLKEGQEVLVQVAKDPIATKGARLTCHISLPGRHLVCMPTIDHVGVSRRIERDEERRRLREFVERNRPRKLGFIVRTASGKQPEKRIRQDIEYLTRLWTEIREKSASVSAPALIYEDLNAVLRSIRDWVTEDLDKIIVDSRYHFNEIQRFVSHFMPSLKNKVDLYHGDIPIFDAYGISTELSRALERKVWLKSGGYIVIDQAEALVAIDVNTGRYVGKKNLEDTILKTNLEAVEEIAYQLRLRNCGGIIILDLIDMEKEENKQRVYRALEEALKKDRARPTILKISELGLVEMTRKRTRDTIIRTLCESCSHCEGKGFIKNKQTVAYEVMREIEREGIERDVSKILVQAHSDVIDILAIDERDTLDQLERRYRKQIYLQSVGDFHPEQFEVTGEKRDRADRSRDAVSSPGPIQPNRSSASASMNRSADDGDSSTAEGEGSEEVRSSEGGEQADESQERIREPREHRSGGRHSSHRDRHRGRDRDWKRNQQRGNRGFQGPQGETAPAAMIIQPRRDEGTEAPVPEHTDSTENAGFSKERDTSSMEHTQRAGGDDDFFSEEDRLAFLRAQAAQDAALANQASVSATTLSSRGGGRPGPGSNRNGGGGGFNRSGGGGGKRRPNHKKGRGGGGGKFNPRRDRDRYQPGQPVSMRAVDEPIGSSAPSPRDPNNGPGNDSDVT